MAAKIARYVLLFIPAVVLISAITHPHPPLSQAAAPLKVVAEVGGATPVGGTFSSFGLGNCVGGPSINDKGHIAFGASVTGGQTPGGIFLSTETGIRKVVAAGDVAPNGRLLTSFQQCPKVNNNDEVLFVGLTGVTGEDAALYLWRGGLVRTIVAPGDPAPGGGTFTGAGFTAHETGAVVVEIDLNDQGDVGFVGTVEGGEYDIAIFVRSAGHVSKVVAIGDSSPTGGDFVYLSGLDLDNAGRAAFEGWTNWSFTSGGLFLGTTTLLAIPTSIPVGTISSICCSPAVNNVTQGASSGKLADGRTGVFFTDDRGTTAVVLDGEATPVGGTFLRHSTYPVDLNDRGQVVFHSRIVGGPASNGIFVSSGGKLDVIVLSGQSGSAGVGHPQINNVGQVAFYDWVAEKIFLFSPDADGDGIVDLIDNCPSTPNPSQADLNGDGIGDICKPPYPAPPGYMLPWPAPLSRKVNVGPSKDHKGDTRFALDFGLVDETVVAARGGKVIEVIENWGVGGCSDKYDSKANMVVVDHGDGTKAYYLHLAQNQVFPKVGDIVIRGQPIGISDSSGHACGAHLHFAVVCAVKPKDCPSGTVAKAVPVTFLDVAGGTPVVGQSYPSGNAFP